MANRPIFIPIFDKEQLFKEIDIEFKWNPGFTATQKQKNIKTLHENAKNENIFPLLEVSTKSSELLGRRLSAFNLKIETKDFGNISIESAFQGSKVFKKNIQYTDIYHKESIEAKKDKRLKESGHLSNFNYFGNKWGLEPKSAFYDWLYVSALHKHKEYLKDHLCKYRGFTDIEFNPKKSFSCQARTCAIVVSLIKLNLLDKAMSSQKNFINIIYKKPTLWDF